MRLFDRFVDAVIADRTSNDARRAKGFDDG
jgi:hypothetical protein